MVFPPLLQLNKQSFAIAKFSGKQVINQFSEYTLSMILSKSEVYSIRINQSAIIQIGIVNLCARVFKIERRLISEETPLYSVSLTLRSPTAVLTLSHNNWVFYQEKLHSIIQTVLVKNSCKNFTFLCKDVFCPAIIQEVDESDYDFLKRLLARYNIHFIDGHSITFIDSISEPGKALTLPKHFQHRSSQYEKYTYRTDTPPVLGHTLSIENQNFIVSSLNHRFHNSLYACKVKLTNALPKLSYTPTKPRLLTGRTVRNHHGHYDIQLLLDPTQQELKKVSSLSPGESDAQGPHISRCHIPILEESEVTVLLSETNLTIIGALNQLHHPSPCQAGRDKSDTLRSKHGHSLTMSDKNPNTTLSLASSLSSLLLSDHENKISLNSTKAVTSLAKSSLLTTQKSVHLSSQYIESNSRENLNISASGDLMFSSYNQAIVQSSLLCLKATIVTLKSLRKSSWDSPKINFIGEEFVIKAKSHLSTSARQLHIKSDKKISLRTNNTLIQLDKSGKITLTAHTISLPSTSTTKIQGEISTSSI